MKKLLLRRLTHRGQECIGIYFDYDKRIQAALQKTGIVKFSRTQRCWYALYSQANHAKIMTAVNGLVIAEQADFQNYPGEKQKQTRGKPVPSTLSAEINTGNTPANWISRGAIAFKNEKISPANVHVLPAMEQHLKLKAFSSSTIKTYLNEMFRLLQELKEIPADQLTPAHLKHYLVYCYEKLQLKENTLHSRINALKFYYEQVLGREKFFWQIPRPKKPLSLPKLLNENELARLFNALPNKKHKALLFTAYSAGLRVSEVVHLKLADIDGQRMQIHIRRGKGKKDRYVNLSPVLLDILHKYIGESKQKPREYLFESEQTGTAYPARTVQQIFTNAKKKAGIVKEVGIHSLRHSFATHLLDKGTDIKYIKDLLGHFDIKTTERYLHVSKKQLVNIVSPFDDLWRKEAIDW